MGILIMAGQLMLSLSILIVLHEMGHFLPARLFGTRVEKFYLFFNPWFTPYKKQIGETEYGIGWLPLGGYVKIAGMIDESFDRDQLDQEPQDYEFRSKPAWQRLIIMLGGVTVNFILGFLLYGMVLWIWGEQYMPAKNVAYGIYADTLGMDLGLQDGDHVLAVGDRPFDIFNDRILVQEIAINNAKTITVERDGQEIQLPVDGKYSAILASYKNKDKRLFLARVPFVAGELRKGDPAENAGIKKEDKIIKLNGEYMPFFNDFLTNIKPLKKQEVEVTVIRNESDTIDYKMTTTEDGTIGVVPYGENYFFESATKDYTLAQAIPAGTIKGLNFLGIQLKAFSQMFRGKIKASDSLGGFASIGKMFGSTWDWRHFWFMTAILSLILAFMNLLPIPALDGGYVVFLLFEVVTGIKPSDKFIENANIVGFILVLGLILFANGLDLFREFF
ncbi:MAG: zinc metalloprotease [Saprospiraceae bacterium]|nr:MAG: zinc metalloprotease [Saprospiraceae bacterium]